MECLNANNNVEAQFFPVVRTRYRLRARVLSRTSSGEPALYKQRLTKKDYVLSPSLQSYTERTACLCARLLWQAIVLQVHLVGSRLDFLGSRIVSVQGLRRGRTLWTENRWVSRVVVSGRVLQVGWAVAPLSGCNEAAHIAHKAFAS